MSLLVSPALKAATLALWRDALAGGALLCVQGTQPTSTASGIDPGDVVGSVPLPLGAVATTGSTVTLTVDPLPALSAAAGAVGWVRAVDSLGATVFDDDAGLPASGATVVFSNLTVATGGELDPLLVLTL